MTPKGGRAPYRLGAALLVASCLAAGCAATEPGRAPAPSPWQRLSEPKPGEWRFVYPEAERSFEAFRLSRGDRGRVSAQAPITVQPLGHVVSAHPELVAALAAFLRAFFGRAVEVEDALPVPLDAFNRVRSQYDAAKVLDFLGRRSPPRSAAYVGLLERDLYFRDYSFLYGLGSLKRGLGVCSIARYGFRYIGQAEDVTLLKRACKVVAHETCHALGLRHCSTWRCVLNGSNSIVEADATPVHLCPHCLRKLSWLLGWDEGKRYRELRAFFRRHPEFEDEAAFAAARLAEKGRAGGG